MSGPDPADLYPGGLPPAGAPPFPMPFPGTFPMLPASDGRQVMQMVQQLNTRVQKLERSKGQMSKDLTEMLREAQDMNKSLDSKRAGVTSPPKGADTSAASSAQAADGADAGGTEPDLRRAITGAPGLAPPPGLQPDALARSKTAGPSEQTVSRRADGPPLPLPEALQVHQKTVNGDTVHRVEWRIDNAKSKFKDCIGRPLVSPQFEAAGLAELRLMVFPNIGLDASSTMRDQKSKFEAVVAQGPLQGVLKFKVVGGEGLSIKFSLFVGGTEKGPMKHNFSEHIIKGCDFDNDWLQEMKQGALVVGVEILKVDPRGEASDEDVVEIDEDA